MKKQKKGKIRAYSMLTTDREIEISEYFRDQLSQAQATIEELKDEIRGCGNHLKCHQIKLISNFNMKIKEAKREGFELCKEQLKESFFPESYPELNIYRPIDGQVLWKVIESLQLPDEQK